MINQVLNYLHNYYGDGYFHDLRPLINEKPSEITEDGIYDLHLDGFVEIQEPSALTELKHPHEIHPILGRLTEKGVFYLEGSRKAVAIVNAINEQKVINLLYTDKSGKEERVLLAPYVYGKDTEEKAVVWGIVSEKDNEHRRFLLDDITITEEPRASFTVDREMQLSQPRDIEVVAQVNY